MYDRLLSPMRIGTRPIRNRVVQLATANRLEGPNGMGAESFAFYEARARGGVGAIVTGALSVHASGDHAFLPAHDRRNLPAFSTLAETVQRHGTLLFGQLNHVGRQHHQNGVPHLVAPSPVPCPGSGGTPHELSTAEIAGLVNSFAASAANLRDAGFDGVEVHGGQGYLIQQFLSPFSNVRTDEYGGSLVNRARFATQIVREIRERCGPDFVVGLRLGVDEFVDGGLTLDLSAEHAAYLTQTLALDYLSVTQANFASIENHTPDRRYSMMPYTHYAERIRQVAGGLPVITCGRILLPDVAEAVLEREQADLIGLCRPLVADPEWVAKAAAGRAEDIVRCISCNQCWGWIGTSRKIACVVNPSCGREADDRRFDGARDAATPAKRVLVAGAGPAGLQAALDSARLGHRVVVRERGLRPGGALALPVQVKGYEELDWAVADLLRAVTAHGVEIEYGAEVTVEQAADLGVDEVIVATGAAPRLDDVAALTGLPVYSYAEVLTQDDLVLGDSVVVLDDDGYYAGTATAEAVAVRSSRVRLVTPYFEVGREIPATCRITTLAALDNLGVELLPGCWIAPAPEGGLRLRRLSSHREWEVPDATSVVRVGNGVAQDRLYHEFVAAGIPARCVGDANQPRRLIDALRDGRQAALLV